MSLEPGSEAEAPTKVGLPFSTFVGIFTGVLLFASTKLPVRDVDLYWHIRAGKELLAGAGVAGIGRAWSFAPDPKPWVTTQWLSEVLLFEIHSLASWPGLVALRTLTATLAVCLVALTTLRNRPIALAAFPFLIASTAVVAVSQERPNQATLIGAAALGGVLFEALARGRVPRWWVALPLTWLWANFHGGWVLAPAILLLVAAGRSLDHGLKDRRAGVAALLSLGCVVAGTLTPAGWASTFAAIRFTSSAELIQEWARTSPLEGEGLLTWAMVLVIALGWARTSVPRSERLATIALVTFSWTALRNVAPALAILAPLVAQRLSSAYPRVGRDPEPRWSAQLGALLAGALLIGGVATLPGRQLLPTGSLPVGLAGLIADLPGQQRVLNDYNVAGMVLLFAGGEDQVGIDGRTDRYGPEYIRKYLELQDVKGQWRSTLVELRPTSALLEADGALAHVLVQEQGWRVIRQQDDWVLLAAG